MNKNTYEPKTLEEEFAFLAGRVAALEAMLNADNSNFIDKKDVASILGISYIPKKRLRLLRRCRNTNRSTYLT